MEPTFKLTAKLWIYPGMSAWHFLSIDKKTTKIIKSLSSHLRRGFGSVKVSVRIGHSKWLTSIFPTKEGEYLLPIKSGVRKAEHLTVNKKVTFEITLV